MKMIRNNGMLEWVYYIGPEMVLIIRDMQFKTTRGYISYLSEWLVSKRQEINSGEAVVRM